METNMELLHKIANGGSFDPVEAIRVLAKQVTAQATTHKTAPAATTALDPEPEPDPEAAPKTRTPKSKTV